MTFEDNASNFWPTSWDYVCCDEHIMMTAYAMLA